MLFPFRDDNPADRFPFVTLALIVINAGSLLWLQSLSPSRQLEVTAHWGFVPQRMAQLRDPNLVVDVDEAVEKLPDGRVRIVKRRIASDRGEILASLLTMMFLHGGWLHLLGNMWFLWIFGNNIEDRLGHLAFLAFYLFCGLAATLCHWAIDPSSTLRVVGASGAVAAVLGAYAITFPQARVRCLVFLGIFITILDLPALLVLGVWFLMQVLGGLPALAGAHLGGGVAWWAHIGGFLAGLAVMSLLGRLIDPLDSHTGRGEWEGDF